MTIHRSAEETLDVAGPLEGWLPRCKQALEATGFERVQVADILQQITGEYRTFTVSGEIEITLRPNGNDTTIAVKATADVNRLLAMLHNPTKAILAKFKREIGVRGRKD
jgi:hypothetical protein